MIDCFAGRYRNGKIECDTDIEKISASVHKNGVALVTGVFDGEKLSKLRQTVFDWGLKTAPQVQSEKSFHRIDHLPPASETPHIFHAYNMYLRKDAIKSELEGVIRPFFTAMKHLQNALTDNDADFQPGPDGRFLRPQVLQYPSGGGFFERHVHPYEPQRIGLIAGLSQQGVDFNAGGTWFESSGKRISLENRHNIGDIALFKYDIPHGISVIDADDVLDWKSPRGRWTMVLPYH